MLEGTKGPFNETEVILIECDYSTRPTFADVLWLETYWHECGVWVFAAHSTDGSWTDAEAGIGQIAGKPHVVVDGNVGGCRGGHREITGGFTYVLRRCSERLAVFECFPSSSPGMSGGFSIVCERLAALHSFLGWIRPQNVRDSASHFDSVGKRASFRQSFWERTITCILIGRIFGCPSRDAH